MENYKLTSEAKADLRRIYRRGVRKYGELQTITDALVVLTPSTIALTIKLPTG